MPNVLLMSTSHRDLENAARATTMRPTITPHTNADVDADVAATDTTISTSTSASTLTTEPVSNGEHGLAGDGHGGPPPPAAASVGGEMDNDTARPGLGPDPCTSHDLKSSTIVFSSSSPSSSSPTSSPSPNPEPGLPSGPGSSPAIQQIDHDSTTQSLPPGKPHQPSHPLSQSPAHHLASSPVAPPTAAQQAGPDAVTDAPNSGTGTTTTTTTAAAAATNATNATAVPHQNKKTRGPAVLARHSGPSLLTQALASARGIPSTSTSSSSSSHSDRSRPKPTPSPSSDTAANTTADTNKQPSPSINHGDTNSSNNDNKNIHNGNPPKLHAVYREKGDRVSVTPRTGLTISSVTPATTTSSTTTAPMAAILSPAAHVGPPSLSYDVTHLNDITGMFADRLAYSRDSQHRGASTSRVEKETKVKDVVDLPRRHAGGAPHTTGTTTPATRHAAHPANHSEWKDLLSELQAVCASRRPDQRLQKGPEKMWSIGSGHPDDGEEDGQVEKAVTEAMMGAEPNARSRKTSHSLRFFREGLPKVPKEEKERGRKKTHRKAVPSDVQAVVRGSEAPSPPPQGLELSLRDSGKMATALPSPRLGPQDEPERGRLQRAKSFPVDLSETAVDESQPRRDYFGLRRTHGQLFDESTDLFSRERADEKDLTPSTARAEFEATSASRFAENRRDSGDSTEVGDSHEEEGDESGEEKISSAVFVPHQGPDESRDDDSDVAPDQRLPTATRNGDFHPWLVKADEPEPEPEDEAAEEASHHGKEEEEAAAAEKATAAVAAAAEAQDAEPSRPNRAPEVAQAGLGEAKRDKLDKHYYASDEKPEARARAAQAAGKREGEVELQDQRPVHDQHVGIKEEPLEAIELIPYRHQVGGHTTLWRFSRRAVCKQLNNRENEFYEKVERHHRDLLTFLPRYIGVLNVTFSKEIRRKSVANKPHEAASSERRQHGEHDATQAPNTAQPPKEGLSDDAVQSANISPRIVSRSLASGQIPIPTVTFDDNKHILPRYLLQPTPAPALPGRSRSTSAAAVPNGASKPINVRTERPKTEGRHANSWGATTINKRLRNEVFNDAFLKQPIPVRKHRRPHQRPIPLRINQAGRSMSDSVAPARLHESHEKTQPTTRETGADKPPAHQNADESEASKPARCDSDEDSPQDVTGTSAPEADTLAEQMNLDQKKKKRRYSGSALRRKPRDVTDSRGHLKYWEQADDARMEGDDDHETTRRPLPVCEKEAEPQTAAQSNGVERSQPTDDIAPPSTQEVATAEAAPVDDAAPIDGVPPMPEFEKIPRPVNPKEAQIQGRKDCRAELFLLLEDLTAGMKRPCIMDLKMGTRQYGVDATPKKRKSQQGKCARTTSRQLGVRVCGLQVWDVPTQTYIFKDKYYGRSLKAGREFQGALTRFLYDGVDPGSILRHIPTILAKLDQLESIVRGLDGYRFYAASLLMFYDGDASREAGEYDTAVEDSTTDFATDTEEAAAAAAALKERRRRRNKREIDFKIADFANSLTKGDLAEGKPCPPQHPNQPDGGFIRGLRSLRRYFLRIQRDVRADMGLVGARGQNGADSEWFLLEEDEEEEGFVSE